MKITPKQYAQALYDSVSNKKQDQVEVAIKKFIQLLDKKGDLTKINKIITNFHSIWNEKEEIVEAKVQSAREISAEITKLLNSYIAKVSSAKKVLTELEIDHKLLGGVVLRYGDKVIDASLKSRINCLKNNINN